MKAFREILISVKDLSDREISDLLKSFCSSSNGFEFKDDKSKQYSRDIGERGFIMHSLRSPTAEPSIIAIAEKTKRTLYVSNIVPMEKNQLAMDEYNAIAFMFFKAFRQHLEKSRSIAEVKMSDDDIGLEKIIPGEKTRKYFKRYLSAYPLSSHPFDIERLDFFTCALRRYHSKVNLGYLKRYLIDDLGWSEEDASWCIMRIETGLDILKANWKFH
jgi:hypothetical protein